MCDAPGGGRLATVKRMARLGNEPVDGVPVSAPAPTTGSATPLLTTRLRPLTTSDLGPLARAQRRHFPHNVIGRFGDPLHATYLRSFLDAPTATAVVAESVDGPVGYALGVLGTVEHRAHVKRRWGLALLLAAGLAIVRHPRLGGGLLRRRLQLRRAARPATEVPPDTRTLAVLSHVAVEPHARGTGAAARLVEDFLDRAREAGCDAATLAVRRDNDRAVRFYAKHGWHRVAERSTFDGRDLLLYEREL